MSITSLSLKWNNMHKELENFATIAKSCNGGRIGIKEFAGFLKMPVSPVLQELFALFDRVCFVVCVCVCIYFINISTIIQLHLKLQNCIYHARKYWQYWICSLRQKYFTKTYHVKPQDGDGTVDFREYVIGMTVLCRPANTEEVIQTAFKVHAHSLHVFDQKQNFPGLLSLGNHQTLYLWNTN